MYNDFIDTDDSGCLKITLDIFINRWQQYKTSSYFCTESNLFLENLRKVCNCMIDVFNDNSSCILGLSNIFELLPF